MPLPSWLVGSAPSYGRPVAMRGPGAMVTIHSTPPTATKPVGRRVSIYPAFDPMATSMSPIPGWTAGAADLAMAA